MATTQQTIEEIRNAISRVNSTSEESSAHFKESVESMNAVTPLINQLVTSITKLEKSFI
jgi:methyl-accepting chemotaxis protein